MQKKSANTVKGNLSIKILLVVFVLAVASYLLFFSHKANSNLKLPTQIGQNSTPSISPSPSPFPFQELTVPFLKSRQYKSSLANLENISTSPNYSTFLTSYQSDGFKINALLTKPAGEIPSGGFPAIVFIHGYIPPNQYQTQTRYIDYVDYLARNGFAVFKIDLRGHGESEGTPGGGYYSSDYVIDALNAYSALQSSDFVNPKKIGLWGHSMAGNIVLRAMAARPDIPVSVIWSGAGYTYIDLSEYRIQDQSYQPQPSDSERQRKRQQLRVLYGDPSEGNPFWKQVAPTSYLNDIKGSIQLNHALDDDVVNINYSRNLNSLLNSTSIPHELHEYPTGGHNISGASFGTAMQNTVAFFNKYLQ